VLVSGTEIGFADVQVVTSLSSIAKVDRSQFAVLLRNAPFPIAFRIERGAVFIVGPDGATITALNGSLRLDIPPGALSSDVGITVQTITPPSVDGGVVVGPAYDFGPDGVVFSEPVSLTVNYDLQQLPSGVRSADVLLATLQDGRWVPFGGPDDAAGFNDEASHTISTQIFHFTVDAVVAPSLPSAPIPLRTPWTAGQFWIPQTYDGHVAQTWTKGVDFYYAQNQVGGSFLKDLGGTIGKPVLAAHAGTARRYVRQFSSLCDADWVPANRQRGFRQYELLITGTNGPDVFTADYIHIRINPAVIGRQVAAGDVIGWVADPGNANDQWDPSNNQVSVVGCAKTPHVMVVIWPGTSDWAAPLSLDNSSAVLMNDEVIFSGTPLPCYGCGPTITGSVPSGRHDVFTYGAMPRRGPSLEVLNFDELTEGLHPRDQYAHRGVVFGSDLDIEDASGSAGSFSGMSLPNILSANGVVPGPGGALGCNYTIRADFVDPTSGLPRFAANLSVLTWGKSNDGRPYTFRLRAFGSSGELIGSDQFQTSNITLPATAQLLSVSAPAIAYVTLDADPADGCHAHDNFSFSLSTVVPGAAWISLTPAGGALPRSTHAAVLDPATNRMIVFAGGPNPSGSQITNDTWVLTGANGIGSSAWIDIVPAGTPGTPPARDQHSLVYDAANNRAIAFGGCLGFCAPVGNDAWVLSNANGLGGTPSWTQLVPTGIGPAGRIGHVAVYDANTNRMIVFGGQDGGIFGGTTFPEVWILDHANGLGGAPSWTLLQTVGGPPPGQYGVRGAYDLANNRMIVFGGGAQGTGLPTNAVWVLTNVNGLGGTATWMNVVAEGAAGSPPIRSHGSAVYDGGTNHLTIFGGQGAGGQFLSDVWVLSNANGLGGTAVWTHATPIGGPVSARGGHASVLDAIARRMTLFGGVTSTGVVGDVWVLTNIY
jgi:hypothetical protein